MLIDSVYVDTLYQIFFVVFTYWEGKMENIILVSDDYIFI